MPQIQTLPAHLADLIAAGEVVERPASVCKELLENALDAGASAVSVELQRGGMAYLRVADNGCGIAPQQLPTAFLRHATSKLRTADELHAIGTLGFRGEALAAICAVSRLDIFSREREAEAGASLHLEGGVPGEVKAAGCPPGTTVCVRDLFYNTPARLKFMKKDSAEGAAASAVVTHLALSRPDVSFRLVRDGTEILHTPGNGMLLDAIYTALGRDFAMSLLVVGGQNGDVTVKGFTSRPLRSHGNRTRQLFFLNGRLVKSQLLTAAVEEAYKNRLMKGKFPGCVLHLTLPAEQVDVNVHPAKTVVKLANEKQVFDAVYYAVKSALDADDERRSVGREKPFYQTMTAQEFRQRSDAPQSAETALPVGRSIGSATAPQPPAAPPPPQEAPSKAPEDTVRPLSYYDDDEDFEYELRMKPTPMYLEDVAPDPTKPFVTPTRMPGLVYHITPPEALREEESVARKAAAAQEAAPASLLAQQEEEEDAPQQTALTLPGAAEGGEAPWRIAGEVLKTYIICEDGEGSVWLIDKHAAHERIRFDALKASPTPPMAQTLLTPVAVTLQGEEYTAVLDELPLLERCGFGCEDFGDGTVLVRSLPSDIDAADTAATLEELAQKLLLHRADPDSLRDELLHTVACKSAIRAGMTSDISELAALVERVQSGEIRYCPHGRPVAVQMTKYQLEKMFKRA